MKKEELEKLVDEDLCDMARKWVLLSQLLLAAGHKLHYLKGDAADVRMRRDGSAKKIALEEIRIFTEMAKKDQELLGKDREALFKKAGRKLGLKQGAAIDRALTEMISVCQEAGV